MSANVGSAYVTIVPSLKGAAKTIQSELAGMNLSGASKTLGQSLAKDMSKGFDTSAIKKYETVVKDAEKGVSDAMRKSAEAAQQVEMAQRKLNDARAKYGDESAQAAQAELNLVKAQNNAARAAESVEAANQKLKQAQADLASATEKATVAAQKQNSIFTKLGGGMTSAGNSMQAAGKAISKLGDGMANIGDKMTAGITAPLAAAVVGVGSFALSTASAAETTEISFTTMLGSAEKAESMMGQLADFAAHTPFELSGLQSATRQLLAYGFTADDVIPMLTAVGDATAALGTGQYGIEAVTRALGQMQTRGKVSAEEMLQLTEQGIPAWEYLARAIGTDTAGAMEQVSAGAISASEGIEAITKGMEEDFGGMMESQSKTLAGLMSNFSDSIEQPLMELRNSDAYEQLADSFSKIVDAAGPFVESMLPHLESGISAVAGVLDSAADAMDSFSNMSETSQKKLIEMVAAAAAAGPAFSVLGRGISAFGKVASGAGTVLSTVGAGVTGLGDKLLDFATAPATAGTALGKLAGAIAGVSTPMAVLGVLVGGTVITGLIALATEAANNAAHQQLLADATQSTANIFSEASGSAEGLGDAIGGIQADAQGTLESLADLNGEVKDSLTKTYKEQGMLDQYVATIEELGNKSGLSATEQYRLKQAVEGYNEVVGTQYSVIDAANGKIADQDGVIQNNTDQLRANAEAWKARATAEAMSSSAAKYMQKEQEATYELSVAQAELNDTQERADAIYKKMQGTSDKTSEKFQKLAGEYDQLKRSIPELEQNVSDLSVAQQSAAKSSSDWAEMSAVTSTMFDTLGDRSDEFAMSMLQTGVSMEQFGQLSDEQMQQLATSWDGSSQSIITALNNMGLSAMTNGAQINSALQTLGNGEIATALQGAGVNLDEFSMALSNAGVSSQQFSQIGSQEFAALANSAGGNIDKLVGLISIYNSAPIYDKNGKITADQTQLTDALGNVYVWNGTQLTTKSGTAVVDASSLQLANDQVLEWNAQGLPTINGTAMAQYDTVELANGQILTWNGSQLTDLEGNVYIEQQELYDAFDNAAKWDGTTLKTIEGTVTVDYSQLMAAKGEINSISGKTFTSTVRINTVHSTSYVTSGSPTAPQSIAPMSYAAAPANAGISMLAAEPAPVYTAGSDGIATPFIRAAAPMAAVMRASSPYSMSDLVAGYRTEDMQGFADDMLNAAGAVSAFADALAKAKGTEDFGKALQDVAKDARESGSDLKGINRLFEKTGVTFTDNFVKDIVSGSSEFAGHINDLANLTDEQLQAVVDTFERTKINEQLIEAQENVRELAEDITESDGLADALSQAGVSVWDFAKTLDSMGMTVDDVEGAVREFSDNVSTYMDKVSTYIDKVSNGFSAMSTEGQTSLDEFKSNLNDNILAARDFQKDVNKVFSMIDGMPGAEEFKEAVMEGGYDQYGQILHDMAESTGYEIYQTLQLFLYSLKEGEKTGEAVFADLADSIDPEKFQDKGKQIVAGLANGILADKDKAVSAIQQVCDAINQTIQSTMQMHSPSKLYEKFGGYLMQGMERGIDRNSGGVLDSIGGVMDGIRAAGVGMAVPATAGGYGEVRQTINFNSPVQTPYQVARAMKRYATYGLAGARK